MVLNGKKKSYTNRKRSASVIKKRMIRDYQLYLLLLLPVAYIIIFKYIPMYGAQIAFKDFFVSKGFWGSPWVGFKHFERFFTSYQFWKVIKNVLGISFYSLAVNFPIPIILALAINNIEHLRYKKAVQLITYAPHFISTTVIVGMLVQFLSPRLGIVNKIIQLVGMEPISFMGEDSWFKSLYVWSDVWQHAGWGTIIYIAALASVDVTLHEAALIDGATKLQRTWYIDLPGILPTAVIILILSTGSIMNVGFEKVFLMQNNLNLDSSEIIQTYLYKVGLASQMPNYSYSTAIGLFNSVINLIFILIVNKIAKTLGETSLW
jgi:ABC-type polysaccharide transport system permease subunit